MPEYKPQQHGLGTAPVSVQGQSVHQIFVVPVEKVREIVNCCMRSALFTSFHEISLICNKQILDKILTNNM